MNLYLLRYPNDKGTPGDLIISRKVFCHTLEDIVRPVDIKIKGKTAIPAGKYSVQLSFSQRFQKFLPEILNVPGFTGIRMHGGNTTLDTDGCILCAHNIVGQNVIQGQAVDNLINLMRTMDEEKTITIINT